MAKIVEQVFVYFMFTIFAFIFVAGVAGWWFRKSDPAAPIRYPEPTPYKSGFRRLEERLNQTINNDKKPMMQSLRQLRDMDTKTLSATQATLSYFSRPVIDSVKSFGDNMRLPSFSSERPDKATNPESESFSKDPLVGFSHSVVDTIQEDVRTKSPRHDSAAATVASTTADLQTIDSRPRTTNAAPSETRSSAQMGGGESGVDRGSDRHETKLPSPSTTARSTESSSNSSTDSGGSRKSSGSASSLQGGPRRDPRSSRSPKPGGSPALSHTSSKSSSSKAAPPRKKRGKADVELV